MRGYIIERVNTVLGNKISEQVSKFRDMEMTLQTFNTHMEF
jgi:hypothetical protein